MIKRAEYKGENMKEGKSVIITGSSKGIGKTLAIFFAIKGYKVLINYKDSGKEAKKLYNRLKEKGCQVEIFKADVSNRQEVDEMVQYCVDKFGSIDILINNAGIAQWKLFAEITQKDWDTMVSINLTGVFNCTQSVLKHMLKNKDGKIINISSIWGIVGASCEVHYSAVKAGIIGMTKALAKELGPSNIKVNCIAPGVIRTDMTSGFAEGELLELKSNTPLLKLGSTKDIGATALFLASKRADFITGQVISPNGGFVV